jgi:hypothetical protein
MDFESYQEAYFVKPPPEPRYKFGGLFGVTLFMEQYEEALAFYSRVLGLPAYVEGDSTRGWRIGDFWLTLLPAAEGNPRNAEIQLAMDTQEDADDLYEAFIEAGGEGEEPTDVLMYEPVRLYPVSDPFGTNILIVARS